MYADHSLMIPFFATFSNAMSSFYDCVNIPYGLDELHLHIKLLIVRWKQHKSICDQSQKDELLQCEQGTFYAELHSEFVKIAV